MQKLIDDLKHAKSLSEAEKVFNQRSAKRPHVTTEEQIEREQGYKEGLAQGFAQSISTILEIKFGEAGQRLSKFVSQIENLEMLQKLMTELKYAKSLSEAEKNFDELDLPKA